MLVARDTALAVKYIDPLIWALLLGLKQNLRVRIESVFSDVVYNDIFSVIVDKVLIVKKVGQIRLAFSHQRQANVEKTYHTTCSCG